MRGTETVVGNFFVWTPHKTLILKIKRGKEFQNKLRTNLVKNWVDYALPKLATRNLEKNSKLLSVIRLINYLHCLMMNLLYFQI